MRTLGKDEKKKRGCQYCLDYKLIRGVGNVCKHDECPHRELDEFETYEDYFQSQGGILEELFREVIG